MLDVEYRAIQEKVKQGEVIRKKIENLQRGLMAIKSGDAAYISIHNKCDRLEILGDNRPNEKSCGFSGNDIIEIARQSVIPEIEKRIADLEAEFAAL